MDNIVEQVERTRTYQHFWSMLMPDVEPPPEQRFLIWMGSYDSAIIERGIRRASRKHAKGENSATNLSVYADSVMRHTLEDQKGHNANNN